MEVKTNTESDLIKEIKELEQINLISTQSSQKSQNTPEKEPIINVNLSLIQDDEEIATNLEDIESYNLYLVQQTNQLIREKQNTERLSNSIERYVIDDAKVD